MVVRDYNSSRAIQSENQTTGSNGPASIRHGPSFVDRHMKLTTNPELKWASLLAGSISTDRRPGKSK
jgi:hypothetical protein